MSYRLNARLDEALAAKVEALRNMTGKSTTDVVKAAIEHYHEALKGRRGSPAERLRATGFVGCAEGSPDLSERYKHELGDLLDRKT